MEQKIEELQKRLPEQHKDLAKYAQHLVDSLDEVLNDHYKMTSLNAVAGISPDGSEFKTFIETIVKAKQMVIDNLEKTVEDIEHECDRDWKKHFPDGVKK